MIKMNFKSSYDSFVYINTNTFTTTINLLLGDMLNASQSKEALKRVKASLEKEFDMKYLGETKKILGVEISRNREKGSLTISQHNYCCKILKKLNMQEAKAVAIPLAQLFKLSSENSPKGNEEEHLNYMSKVPYSQVLGSLMYLMILTRVDLSYSTSLASLYMAKSGKRH